MRRAFAAAVFALLLSTGCGAQRTRAVIAFEMPWPHGLTRITTNINVLGNVDAVYLGAHKLTAGRWTCIRGRAAATYRLTATAVAVELDDDTTRCLVPVNDPVDITGGYALAGGYVGEWSPGAIVVIRATR